MKRFPSFDLSSFTFTRKDTVPLKAEQVLAHVLFGKIVQNMEVKFNMTTRHKSIFGCLQAANAHNFLLAIPIDGLCQHMSPVEYRTILKYRLMIPLFPIDEVCPVCSKADWITLGSTQYIVESFQASNTCTALFEMIFLMF
jgi:hypothetical protein